MRKMIGLLALAGLTACSSPDKMYYEVTQRGAGTVSLHVNVGNMKRQSAEVAAILAHMDGMAVAECQNMGKKGARVTNEWARTAGAYNSWIERSYDCY